MQRICFTILPRNIESEFSFFSNFLVGKKMKCLNTSSFSDLGLKLVNYFLLFFIFFIIYFYFFLFYRLKSTFKHLSILFKIYIFIIFLLYELLNGSFFLFPKTSLVDYLGFILFLNGAFIWLKINVKKNYF